MDNPLKYFTESGDPWVERKCEHLLGMILPPENVSHGERL